MNPTSLNFLQHKPDENWFDYFIDHDKFLKLLQDEKTDQKLIEKLFDQSVEKALWVITEASNAKRKQLDQGKRAIDQKNLFVLENMDFAQKKSDKLWLLGWACAAKLSWDLNTLLKCSNVIRVYSMVCRLFEHVFNVKEGSDISSYLLDKSTVFNSKSIFVAWLYARLVLIVDMQARVPAPPQKPTVSNPANQPDQALIEAEKINNFIAKIKNHTQNAAILMRRLIELNMDKIEIPSFYCFQQLDIQNGNASTSDFQTYIQVSGTTFAVRVKCDLMLAHFAARHFATARKLLNEIAPNFKALDNVNKVFMPLFAFDSKKFDGYKAALAEPPKSRNKRQKLDINPFEFNTQRLRNVLTTEVNLKVNAELEKATKAYESAAVIPLSTQATPLPSPSALTIYTEASPPLWQILHCYDYIKLLPIYKQFCEWDPNEKKFLNTIVKGNYSPIFAKMLEEKPVDEEPVLFYVMQLERLIDNWNLEHWKAVIATFLDRMIRGRWSSHVHAVCFELLRINERVYNSTLGYERKKEIVDEIFKTVDHLANEALKTQNSLTTWSLKLFDKLYFVTLLNLGKFESIIKFPNDFPQVQSQYLIFARIVSTFILHEQQKNEIQWNYFLPLLHRGPFVSDRTLSRENFVDMIRMLKNVRVCEYIMSYFVTLYNLGANVGERQHYPYAKDLQSKDINVLQIDKSILNVKEVAILDKLIKEPENINLDFLLSAMEIILRNIILSKCNNPFVLCQLADLLYATDRYEEAARLYTRILGEFKSGLCNAGDEDKIVNDSMISKLVHCLYELKFFTLSAITGQLLNNAKSHLLFVPSIIEQTPQTNDGGKAYFSYIFDVPIYEAMAAAYEQLELYTYHIQLIKLCPTRASNQGNSADVTREETNRRRSQFIQILFRTMNSHPKALSLFSDKTIATNVV